VKFGYCECSAAGRGAAIRGYHRGPAVVVGGSPCIAVGVGAPVSRPSCGGYQALVERRRCQSVGFAETPCWPSDRLRVSDIPVRRAATVAEMGRALSIEETGWRGMTGVGEGERDSSASPVPGGFRNVLASLFTWKDVGGPSTPMATIITSRSCTTTWNHLGA